MTTSTTETISGGVFGFSESWIDQPEAWMQDRIQKGQLIAVWTGGATPGIKIHYDPQLVDAEKKAAFETRWKDAGFVINPGVLLPLPHLTEALEYFSEGDVDVLLVNFTAMEWPVKAKDWLTILRKLHPQNPHELTLAEEDMIQSIVKHVPEEMMSHPFWMNLCGKILALRGMHAVAGLYFRNAIERCSDYSEPYNNLGTLLWNLEQKREAFLLFAEALMKNPYNSSAQLNFFDSGYEMEEYASIVAVTEFLIQKVPTCIEFHHHLAICYRRLQRTEDAITVLQKILDKDPMDAEARSLLIACEGSLQV